MVRDGVVRVENAVEETRRATLVKAEGLGVQQARVAEHPDEHLAKLVAVAMESVVRVEPLAVADAHGRRARPRVVPLVPLG